MIEMTVSHLAVDPMTKLPIVILKGSSDDDALPIWIGLTEANSIATELEKVIFDRPMTHDLIKQLITAWGGMVTRVEIRDVKNGTFYASVFVRGPHDKVVILDARPSDAIAIALR